MKLVSKMGRSPKEPLRDFRTSSQSKCHHLNGEILLSPVPLSFPEDPGGMSMVLNNWVLVV